MQKNNAVELIVATDGRVKSEQRIPKISGYEEVRSIRYNYDTASDQTEVEIRSDEEIMNPESLLSSIIRTAPDSSGIRVICNAVSKLLDRSRHCSMVDLDCYGRMVH